MISRKAKRDAMLGAGSVAICSIDIQILHERLIKQTVHAYCGCWDWTGKKNVDGYGSFKVTYHGRVMYVPAHRVSYYVHNLRMPEDHQVILHSCNRPPCVNPAHLSLGTQKENMEQCVREGRKHTKLTPEDVRTIRSQYADGASCIDLATKFHVTWRTVDAIILGKAWQGLK